MVRRERRWNRMMRKRRQRNIASLKIFVYENMCSIKCTLGKTLNLPYTNRCSENGLE